jgi:hypothetical protein
MVSWGGRANKPQVWLPTPHRDVMHADKNEILQSDLILPMANFPSHVRVILEWMVSICLKLPNIIVRSERRKQSTAYLDETLHTFSNVLRELGHRDRSRRTPEVLSWDLSAPLAVPWPLENEENQQQFLGRLLIPHLKSNRNTGSSPLKNEVFATL